MNAYNAPGDHTPRCWNKEWLAQFMPQDCHVRRDEFCGTWQQRTPTQKPILWNAPIQLDLFS